MKDKIDKDRLSDKIYYLNQEILAQIACDFDLIDQRQWYELYQYKMIKLTGGWTSRINIRYSSL